MKTQIIYIDLFTFGSFVKLLRNIFFYVILEALSNFSENNFLIFFFIGKFTRNLCKFNFNVKSRR